MPKKKSDKFIRKYKSPKNNYKNSIAMFQGYVDLVNSGRLNSFE